MTEKRLFVGKKTVEDRFTIILDYDGEIGVRENMSGDVVVLKHRDLNSEQFVGQLVLFLNDQNEAIHQSFEKMEYWSDKAIERIKELENENEQLKKEKEFLKEEIILIEKVKDDFYDKTKSLLHEFIEYYQLKPGNNDNVTDCLEELKKELFE